MSGTSRQIIFAARPTGWGGEDNFGKQVERVPAE